MLSYLMSGDPRHSATGLVVWPQSECGRSYEVWCGVPTALEPIEETTWAGR